MASYRTTRIIPVAFILIIAALAVAALFSMARGIFFPNAVDTNTAKVGHDTLISSTADCSVKMVVRGPIVSEEESRSYEITVTPSQRKLVTYQGYIQTVLERVELPNNIPAYEEFVYALDDARMMTAPEFKGDKNDLRGVCARGYLYVFSISNEGKLVKELWTTSCADERGSLGVKFLPIKNLFNYQIPESKTIINKLWR